MRVALDDSPTQDLLSCIPACNAFMQAAFSHKRGRVLIHCYAGRSRSAAVCIGHLMCVRKLPYETAFNLVSEQRNISPNENVCMCVCVWLLAWLMRVGAVYQAIIVA